MLNLAGAEVAHLKGLLGTTSVRDIKRRLERQLKDSSKKFSPMCLQGLCYKDQNLSRVVRTHTGCRNGSVARNFVTITVAGMGIRSDLIMGDSSIQDAYLTMIKSKQRMV